MSAPSGSLHLPSRDGGNDPGLGVSIVPATLQTMPNTIAAMKPNDRTAASTFSRIVSSIVASMTAALVGDSCSVRRGDVHRYEKLGVHLQRCQVKTILRCGSLLGF